jgi:carbon-monoxide dehydrogenase medium subunit
VKPAPFEYHAPGSAKEAVDLLAELGDEAKVIAGGQSLVPVLAMRLAAFGHLIDIRRITALAGIEERGDSVWIGAGTTEAEIGRSEVIARRVPLLSRATPLIGHFQIRNRGTIGGSLAHADAAAEYPAVALALDATVEALSPRGQRTIPAAEFFTGIWTTALAPDELLTGVSFPAPVDIQGGRQEFAIEEFARRPGDFAVAGAAVAVGLDPSSRVSASGIGLFGLGPTVARAVAAEATSIRRRSGGPPWRTWTRSRPTCTAPPTTGGRWARPWWPAPGRRPSRRQPVADISIEVTVNGQLRRAAVEPRLTLADFLRERCQLTGTHLGCEHGVCGACTVLLDGQAVRGCLVFAVQADGGEITTVEGIAAADGTLSPVQQAFREHHGLQCGFCTPGFVTSVTAFLRDNPSPTDEEIREGLSGNLCRCTGYQGILAAVRAAAGSINTGSVNTGTINAGTSNAASINEEAR